MAHADVEPAKAALLSLLEGRAPPIRDTEQVSEATASTTDLLDQVGRRLRARESA